jgi:[ribosomal protein S5]-alanine N-acetyltransferase
MPTRLASPDPDLTDGVVRLRRWAPTDVECVQAASTDPRITESTTVPVVPSEAAALEFIERQHRRAEDGEGWSFTIAAFDSDEAMGSVTLMLRPQAGVVGVGYWLTPARRGRGSAGRAVDLVTRWALQDRGFARVEAWVEPGNDVSISVLRGCGFTEEGRLRSHLALGDRRADALVFSRTST